MGFPIRPVEVNQDILHPPSVGRHELVNRSDVFGSSVACGSVHISGGIEDRPRPWDLPVNTAAEAMNDALHISDPGGRQLEHRPIAVSAAMVCRALDVAHLIEG